MSKLNSIREHALSLTILIISHKYIMNDLISFHGPTFIYGLVDIKLLF